MIYLLICLSVTEKRNQHHDHHSHQHHHHYHHHYHHYHYHLYQKHLASLWRVSSALGWVVNVSGRVYVAALYGVAAQHGFVRSAERDLTPGAAQGEVMGG